MSEDIPVSEEFFSFEGRINRLKYLVQVLIPNALVFIGQGFVQSGSSVGIGVILSLAGTIMALFPAVKRLHDMNYSGWVLLIGIIPLVNLILIFLLFLKKGTEGPNAYGPDPLQA